MPPKTAALDFFQLLFPDTLWKLLVTETTRYAEQRNAVKGDDVAANEMKAFIGLMLGMAMHHLPRIENYWSSHWVLSVPQCSGTYGLTCTYM